MAALIRGYTANFSFKLINFDAPRWHTLEYQNWRSIDTILAYMTGFSVNRGVWDNGTAYIVGDRVIDDDDGTIWTCQIAHTSIITGSFATDRSQYPGNWLVNTTLPVNRGVWATNRAYNIFDIVTPDNYSFYFCNLAHTSGVFATDLANGRWVSIFSAASLVTTINDLNGRIYPPSSSDPILDPLGNPPTQGDMYFNTTTQQMRVRGASTWGDLTAPPPASTASSTTFTPASGIAATNVQNAIIEAKTDAQTYADAANVTQDTNIASTYAPKNAPAFIGNAISVTPAVDNNSTTIATTAYVVGQLSSDNPLSNGIASPGSSLRGARKDHVHPSDASRAPVNSPVFTGSAVAPTFRSQNAGAGIYDFYVTDAGVDTKWSRHGATSTIIYYQFLTDGGAVQSTPFYVARSSQQAVFSVRPSFAGYVPWDTANLSTTSFVKAWATYSSFSGFTSNLGFSGLSRAGVGYYVFTLATAMASTAWCPMISLGHPLPCTYTIASQTTNQLQIQVYDNVGSPIDPYHLAISCFGP